MNRFLATDQSVTSLFQRIVLALVIFPHGAQKLLGWFGGYGFEGTVQWFASALHVPAPLAALVILAESLGAIGLVFGLGTRLAAAGIAASMAGAIVMVHAQHGFFMNWFGSQGGEGFEYHLLALALSIPLMVRGAGAFSLDGLLAGRLSAAHPQLTRAHA